MSLNDSSTSGQGLSRDDPLFWQLPPTIDCNIVRTVGIFLCLASLVGICLNSSLLFSLLRYKVLRTPPNVFIMFIAAMGLLASCGNLPLSGSSSVFCRWLYGRSGCQMEGLIAFLYGCASCYLLCTVSLSRCYIIIRPFDAKAVTVKKCVIIASVAVLVSLLITLMPLFGWNEYTLEGTRTSCCTNLYDPRPLFVSYNLFIFIVVYCIPLVILIVSNTLIYFGLKQMQDKAAHGIKTELSNKRIEMERRILKSIVMTVLGFVFTWTPYAIAFCVAVFSSGATRAPPAVVFVCACFAKTSVMWIPMLFMGTSTQFRFSIVDPNVLGKQPPAATIVGETTNTAVTVRKSEK